jgi:TRAP-type C4-dicarboxylate transport system substrate-binding protein
MVSPRDIAALIPEYSVFTTGCLMRSAHLDAVYDGDIGAGGKAKIEKDVGITLVKGQYLGTRHHPARGEGGRRRPTWRA